MAYSKSKIVTLLYVFLGFWSICVQSLFIREFLVVMYGNELILGSLFAIWFFWIVVGAGALSFFLSKRRIGPSWFWWTLFAGMFSLPVQLAAIRLTRVALGIPVGVYIPFSRSFLWMLVCMAPTGFTIGATFPLGAAAFERLFKERRKLIGALYYFEAFGSLTGGLIFTFLFLKYLSPYQLIVVLIAIWGILLFLARKVIPSGEVLKMGFAWVAFVLILVPMTTRLEQATRTIRWQHTTGLKLSSFVSFETPYHHVTVARSRREGQLFLNGQLTSVFPDHYQSTLEANILLLQHPNPEKVAVISASLSDLLPALLQNSRVKVDWLMQDSALLAYLKRWFDKQNLLSAYKERFRLITGDGRLFLRNRRNEYDILFLDLPRPSSASLNRFYTVEFFELVNRSLRNGGVFVLRFPLVPNYLSGYYASYLASILKTAQTVFASTVFTGNPPYFLFCSNDSASLSNKPEVLFARWQKRSKKSSAFNPYLLYTVYDSTQISFYTDTFEKVKTHLINSDSHPLCYYFDLLIWNELAREYRVVNHILERVTQIRRRIIPFAIIILFLLVGLLLSGGKKRRARLSRKLALMSISISGFTAMSLEIILLLEFQNRFGALYQYVALVTAGFMFGLAVGSMAGNRILAGMRNLLTMFVLFHSAAVGMIVLLPAALIGISLIGNLATAMISGIVLFLAIVFLVGVITGALFPIAGASLLESGITTGRSAGSVDAADHLGACLGAFIVGSFFLPILGRSESLIILALLNGSLAVLWAIFLKRKSSSNS